MERIFLIYFQSEKIISPERFMLRVTNNCARKIYSNNMIFAMCHDLTAKQLHEKLFINPDERNHTIVVEMANYFCNLPADVVDWLDEKEKQAKAHNESVQA